MLLLKINAEMCKKFVAFQDLFAIMGLAVSGREKRAEIYAMTRALGSRVISKSTPGEER